jgi:hypothetical protein
MMQALMLLSAYQLPLGLDDVLTSNLPLQQWAYNMDGSHSHGLPVSRLLSS